MANILTPNLGRILQLHGVSGQSRTTRLDRHVQTTQRNITTSNIRRRVRTSTTNFTRSNISMVFLFMVSGRIDARTTNRLGIYFTRNNGSPHTGNFYSLSHCVARTSHTTISGGTLPCPRHHSRNRYFPGDTTCRDRAYHLGVTRQ